MPTDEELLCELLKALEIDPGLGAKKLRQHFKQLHPQWAVSVDRITKLKASIATKEAERHDPATKALAIPSSASSAPPSDTSHLARVVEQAEPEKRQPESVPDPVSALGSEFIGSALDEFQPPESQAIYDQMVASSPNHLQASQWNIKCIFSVENLTLEHHGQPWWITDILSSARCRNGGGLSDNSCVEGILHIVQNSPRGPEWGDLVIADQSIDDPGIPPEHRCPIHETCTRYLSARYFAATAEGCTALALNAIYVLTVIAFCPPVLPILVGSRVRLQGMTTSELNGAVCEVRKRVFDGEGLLCRYSVQVLEPDAAAAKYPNVINVKTNCCFGPSHADADSCKFARQALATICSVDVSAQNRTVMMLHSASLMVDCENSDPHSSILLAAQARLARVWTEVLKTPHTSDFETALAHEGGIWGWVIELQQKRLRYCLDNFDSLARTSARDLFWMSQINHPEAKSALRKLFLSTLDLLRLVFRGGGEPLELNLTHTQTGAVLVLCELLCRLVQEDERCGCLTWKFESLLNTHIGPWLQRALPPYRSGGNSRYARIKLFQGKMCYRAMCIPGIVLIRCLGLSHQQRGDLKEARSCFEEIANPTAAGCKPAKGPERQCHHLLQNLDTCISKHVCVVDACLFCVRCGILVLVRFAFLFLCGTLIAFAVALCY